MNDQEGGRPNSVSICNPGDENKLAKLGRSSSAENIAATDSLMIHLGSIGWWIPSKQGEEATALKKLVEAVETNVKSVNSSLSISGCPSDRTTVSLRSQPMKRLIGVLGSIHGIEHLTVEDFALSMPIRYITTLMVGKDEAKKSTTTLCSLKLDNIIFTGSRQKGDFDNLAVALRAQKQLRHFDMNIKNRESSNLYNLHNAFLVGLSDATAVETVKIVCDSQAHLVLDPQPAAALLSKARTLQTLHLSGIELTNDFMSQVAQAFWNAEDGTATPLSIRQLYLEKCKGLLPSGLKKWANAIRVNRSLEKVTLHCDSVNARSSDKVPVEFASALEFNSSLREICITSSGLFSSQEAEAAFRKMLRSNMTLCHLQLDEKHEDVGCRGFSSLVHAFHPEITHYLILNRLGRRQFHEEFGSKTTRDWISILAQAGENLNAFYYFLRLNPALCPVRTNNQVERNDWFVVPVGRHGNGNRLDPFGRSRREVNPFLHHTRLHNNPRSRRW